MKKLVFITLLFITTGCSAIMAPISSSRIADNVHIGMTVKEFLNFAGNRANLETLTPEGTVYSLEAEGYVAGAGLVVAGKRLFHFNSSGRLVRMDSRDFRENRDFYRRDRADDRDSDDDSDD